MEPNALTGLSVDTHQTVFPPSLAKATGFKIVNSQPVQGYSLRGLAKWEKNWGKFTRSMIEGLRAFTSSLKPKILIGSLGVILNRFQIETRSL